MGTPGEDAGVVKGAAYGREHTTGAEGPIGSAAAEEHLACGRRGSAATQVRGEPLADILGQGQAAVALALATDEDLSRTPVQVVEFECGNVGGSEAQADHEAHDGAIAASRR